MDTFTKCPDIDTEKHVEMFLDADFYTVQRKRIQIQTLVDAGTFLPISGPFLGLCMWQSQMPHSCHALPFLW